MEYEDSDVQDYKHTEDEDPKGPAPVVAEAPAAAAPVVLPPIVPRHSGPFPHSYGPVTEEGCQAEQSFVGVCVPDGYTVCMGHEWYGSVGNVDNGVDKQCMCLEGLAHS